MEENKSLRLFEDKNIRVAWNEIEENWYFSVVDIIAVLTENDYQKSRNYWKWLKNKLIEEGSELVSNTNQLKMKSSDGKYYNTDVMNTEQILRLVQSIPSKKAEPFKLWLAQVGKERIDEAYDPEITINRALDTYRKKGYSVKEYKNLKGLKKENLRDNMTNMELVLNMLAETTSTEISKSTNEQGIEGAEKSVIKGGNIARIAKEQLEKVTICIDILWNVLIKCNKVL